MTVQDGTSLIRAIADLVEAVAKLLVPIFVIVLLWRFQNEIPDLIRRFKRGKILGQEIELAEAAKAFEASIETGAKQLADRPEDFLAFVRKQVKKLPAAPVAEGRSASRVRILWVDDNPLNNSFEASLLGQRGSVVDQVPSTDQALRLASERQYDVVISDLERYENGGRVSDAGLRLIEQLRAANKLWPVVIYTSPGARIDADASRRPAPDAVVYFPDDLFKVVDDLASRSRRP